MKIKPYKVGEALVFDASGYSNAPDKSTRLVASVVAVHEEQGSYAYSMLASNLSDPIPYWVDHDQLSPALEEDIKKLLNIKM